MSSTSLAALTTLGGELTDLADAFAVLYDYCLSEPPLALDVSRSIKSDTPDVVEAADELLRLGKIPRLALHEAMLSGDPRSVLGLLRAIDRALGSVDPYVGSARPGPLEHYRHRFESTQRLNVETAGAVLPRRTSPGRPRTSLLQAWPDSLLYLIRVSPGSTTGAYFRIDTEWDLPATCRDTDVIGVAALAFLDSRDQLEIERRSDPTGHDWYSISPRPLGDWGGAEHVRAALAALDDSGAVLAVLPELTLNDELLAEWRTAASSAPRPATSVLHWIFLGTGPVTAVGPYAEDQEQPPNRLVVLDRQSGQVVELPDQNPYIQDKNKGFTLDPGTIDTWGLAGDLKSPTAPDVDLAEWMHEGQRRLVIDTRAGRLVVLICEDHGRLLTEVSAIKEYGPSHIFVPIFSEPIRRHFWEEKGARTIASEIGSSTLVVNSSVVSPPGSAKDTVGALLVEVVRGGPPSTWSVASQGSPSLLPGLDVRVFEMRRD